MSKCAEPGTFELEVLIEENEDFGTAFEKTRSRVLKALLAEIKERFGYSPEVCKTRLLEEFFCENTIDWASDVLGAKKSGLDWKRPHTSGETDEPEKCGKRLNKTGLPSGCSSTSWITSASFWCRCCCARTVRSGGPWTRPLTPSTATGFCRRRWSRGVSMRQRSMKP